MRPTPLFLAALFLSACATLPEASAPNAVQLGALDGATDELKAVAQMDQQTNLQQAQLTDIREAQTRLDLARTRLDYATVRDRAAEDGDVREFLDARRSLRQLHNAYGPTDTGRQEFLYRPFGPFWPRRHDRWDTSPAGTAGTAGISKSDTPTVGAAMPLSGLPGR
ncbi:MAG: hypothetical protein WBF53_01240 [Litorimonas sp.]